MTIARSEDINKDDTSMLNVFKNCLVFRQTLRYSFNKGNSNSEFFFTEVFVMPKHLMTKVNIPKSSHYLSPLRAIVLSKQYCRITVI